MTDLAFGRNASDPVRLAAVPSILAHVPDLRQPPDRLDRSGVPINPQSGANTWAPDCTGESLREIMSAVALLGGYALNVEVAASLAFYMGCRDLPPDATREAIIASEGADMLMVAQRQWQRGFPTGTDTLFGQFGTVPPTDRAALAAGAATFGAIWAGVMIHARDLDTFYGPEPWDDDGTDPGPVVARHAIMTGWGWTGLGDADETVTITWGRAKATTWRWLRARLEEAHAFRWRQLDPAGAAVVDEERLSAALAQWAAAYSRQPAPAHA